MLFRITLIVSVGLAMKYALQYFDWLDLDDPLIYHVQPGDCREFLKDGGAEDMSVFGEEMDHKFIIMSSGLGQGRGGGSIKALDTVSEELYDLDIVGAPTSEDFMARPHGIYIYTDRNTGEHLLYLITHPEPEDRVEVFEIRSRRGRPYALAHLRTITDPSFRYMNDLVVVARDQFYITRYFWARGDVARTMFEVLTRRHWGAIQYYDGRRARTLVENLFIPNGINISPDGKMLYVAEFGNKNLLGFYRSGMGLNKAWEVEVDTAVDNIDVDPATGDLWIGCHPTNFRVFESLAAILNLDLPSQVLRVRMTDGHVSEVRGVYADDGSQVYGSTVATNVSGKLYIGTITRNAVVCDIHA